MLPFLRVAARTLIGLGAAWLFAPAAAWAQASPSVAKPQKVYSPWQTTEDSWFAATVTDMGFIYVRPRLNVGYGSPHWQYVALDTYVIVTNSFTAPYAGWRATFPFFDAYFGARRTLPYDRRFLPPADSHEGNDLSFSANGGRRSHYNAVELELALLLPVLHGVVYAQVHPVAIDAPRGVHVFEEVLRVVMVGPMAVGTRAGYLYGIGEDEKLKLGGVFEYVVVPNRPKNVVRAGPVGFLDLGKTFSALAAFSVVLDSPDSLGVVHGTYAYLGILHRWAVRF